MSDDLSFAPADFADLIGTELRLADSELALTVDTVMPLRPHALRAEPFSLILRVPAGYKAAQGIYTFEHPRRGRIELFCAPIEPVQGQARLEATFN
jgi:hypothetical protein